METAHNSLLCSPFTCCRTKAGFQVAVESMPCQGEEVTLSIIGLLRHSEAVTGMPSHSEAVTDMPCHSEAVLQRHGKSAVTGLQRHCEAVIGIPRHSEAVTVMPHHWKAATGMRRHSESRTNLITIITQAPSTQWSASVSPGPMVSSCCACQADSDG